MPDKSNHLARHAGATLSLLLALTASGLPATAQDGKAIYDDTCVRCHGNLEEQSSWLRFLPRDGSSVDVAVVLPQGPTLTGIVGRPAGTVEGYKYSKAMRAFAKTGAIWDRDTLDKFLTNSRKFVKGTFMIVRMDEEERQLVLDYLEQVAVHRP